MEDCERTLCGGIRGSMWGGESLGLGSRDANFMGNTTPLSLKKKTPHCTYCCDKSYNAGPFSPSDKGKRQIRSYVTCWNTTGSVGCQCWTFSPPLHCSKWGGKSFHEDEVKRTQCGLQTFKFSDCSRKLWKTELHVALKTSLIHASCVFYCMPITAMWM